MTNSLWNDFKLKFFKSGNPALLYIGLNALIFILVSLLSVFAFFMGKKGAIDVIVQSYLAFPSAVHLWLTNFYTMISYQFLHADFFHVLFNMLWLYWIGQLLLDFIKPRQFHFIYLSGGIFGALFFALLFNLMPVYSPSAHKATIIGSSASVMAILAAMATLVPNYSIRLMFFGDVKIKYLVLVYIVLDLMGTASANAGGSLAHLGGALFGFVYVKFLQNGTDLSAIFKQKPKLRVVKTENPKKQTAKVNQQEIDAILDKISVSGYDKLTKTEKETLFRASKD
jgi:membrane associated rhomboid family serine protease